MLPTLGQQFSQYDRTPSQSIKRHQSRQTIGFDVSAEMAQKNMLIAPSLMLGEPHAWVHDEVRDAGNGIVPAEILEIQEVQFPVRSPQGVVRTEIGWDQGAAFRGNLGGEIKSQPPVGLASLRFESVK